MGSRGVDLDTTLEADISLLCVLLGGPLPLSALKPASCNPKPYTLNREAAAFPDAVLGQLGQEVLDEFRTRLA